MKLAVLGAGDVAQRDYLPEMHRLAGKATVVAICSRTEARARSVAQQYNVPSWYTDYREMLERSGADAVVNLTPMQLHGETNLAILEAGKHLYSEKPFAGSVAEAEALRREADRNGRTVVAAPSVLLFPQLRMLRELLRNGELGAVHSATARVDGGAPPWAGFMSDPSQYFQQGGGPAVDLAVYPLHALTGLLGPVRRVAAMSARAQTGFTPSDGPLAGQHVPIDVDDAWQVLLDFGGALIATVSATYCVGATRVPQLEVHGLERTAALSLLSPTEPVLVSEPAGGWDERPVDAEREEGPDHILGVEHLIDCVEQGLSPLASVDHAIHVLRVLELAGESAATGRAQLVEGDSAFEPGLT